MNAFNLPLKEMNLSNIHNDDNMDDNDDSSASSSGTGSVNTSPNGSPLTSPRLQQRPSTKKMQINSQNRNTSPNLYTLVSKNRSGSPYSNTSPLNKLPQVRNHTWVESSQKNLDESNMGDSGEEDSNFDSDYDSRTGMEADVENMNQINIPNLQLSGLSNLARNQEKNGRANAWTSRGTEKYNSNSGRQNQAQPDSMDESDSYDTETSARNSEEALYSNGFKLNLSNLNNSINHSEEQTHTSRHNISPRKRPRTKFENKQSSQAVSSQFRKKNSASSPRYDYEDQESEDAEKFHNRLVGVDYIIKDILHTKNTTIDGVQRAVSRSWFQSQEVDTSLFDVVTYKDKNNEERIAVTGSDKSTIITLNDYLRVAKERNVYKRRAEQLEAALQTIQSSNESLHNELNQEKQTSNNLYAENEFLRQKLSHYEKLRNEMLSTVENLKQQHGMLIEAIVTSHAKSPDGSNSARTPSKFDSPLPRSPSGPQSARK